MMGRALHPPFASAELNTHEREGEEHLSDNSPSKTWGGWEGSRIHVH